MKEIDVPLPFNFTEVIKLNHRDSAFSLTHNLTDDVNWLSYGNSPEIDIQIVDDALATADQLMFNLRELKKELLSEINKVD